MEQPLLRKRASVDVVGALLQSFGKQCAYNGAILPMIMNHIITLPVFLADQIC